MTIIATIAVFRY